jgi:hypothetical protein
MARSVVRIHPELLVVLIVAAAPIAHGAPRPGVLPERVVLPNLASTRLHLDRDWTIPVRVGCAPQPYDCGGRLFVETVAATPRLLTVPRTYTSAPGRRIVVRLRLSHAGRALLGQRTVDVQLVDDNLVIKGQPNSGEMSKPLTLSLR